jgi:hypothetical protein
MNRKHLTVKQDIILLYYDEKNNSIGKSASILGNLLQCDLSRDRDRAIT